MSCLIWEEVLILVSNLVIEVLNRFFPVRTEHSERFSRPCLTICKYSAVETRDNPQDWVFTNVIHIGLRPILCNNFVISTLNQMDPIGDFDDLGLELNPLTPFSARTTSSWPYSRFKVGLILIATRIRVAESVWSVGTIGS